MSIVLMFKDEKFMAVNASIANHPFQTCICKEMFTPNKKKERVMWKTTLLIILINQKFLSIVLEIKNGTRK